jgi:hypothetical protein
MTDFASLSKTLLTAPLLRKVTSSYPLALDEVHVDIDL